jgi:ABC-type branched-subunit amino acid transport system substrate-binding protein
MRTKLTLIALSLGAVSLIGVAMGCGDSEGDSAGASTGAKDVSFTMRIGDLVPLTGDLSVLGPAARKAADLAAEQINDAAGDAGVDATVEVEHADSETNPQSAVQAAQRLLAGGSNCIVGEWASSATLAVAQSVTTRRAVPQISPASTSAAISTLEDDGFLYRLAPSDDLSAHALADVMETQLGGTSGTISLAGRNDAYGEGYVTAVKEAWEAKGGKTTGPVLYDPEQPGYNSEAAQIVSGDPAAYVIIDFPETYARMGAALVRTGRFDASKMFTGDSLGYDVIPEDVPRESLEGTTGVRPSTPRQSALAEQFDELARQAGGPGRQTFDVQNFDSVITCYLAAVAAKSTDGAKVAAKLQQISGPPGKKYDLATLSEAIRAAAGGDDIDFDGVSGPIDFDDNGDPTSATYDEYSYKDGKLAVTRQFEAGS